MPAAGSQQAFAAALLDPARDVPAGLRVGEGVDARRRFAVHRNNAVVALVDALALAFPVTQALVGSDFFRAMARERVHADPPRSPIVADYGAGFAGFIARFAPAAGVAYLADIARLEWLRMRAFHAADAAPVAAAAWRALVAAPDRLAATRISLHPACAWLRSEHALWSIWHAHHGLEDVGSADLDGIEVDRPEAVLVTRPHYDLQVTRLPAGGAELLDALADGLALDAAMTRAAADAGTGAPAQLPMLLALLVERGLAVALHCPPEH